MGRSRDERGAVIPMVALLMTVLLGITAIAVDIGHQRVERRDAQAIADLVALDMARHLNGDIRAVIKNTHDFKSGARQSVARNLNVTPLPLVSVEPNENDVVVTVPDMPVRVTVVLGQFDASGGFRHIDNSEIPDAVEVTVDSAVDYAFVPGKGKVSRSAVASASNPTVCFSIGTKALALDTNESVLSPLLSEILRVNLDAVSYEGLVALKDVSVPLLGLAAALNAGSVDELLNTTVDIGTFNAALVTALGDSGDSVNAGVLDALKIHAPALDEVRVGDILMLDSASGEAALLGSVNVLDILTAGLLVANGDTGVGLVIPGLASLKITQPPQIACGAAGAVAKSAQIELVVDTELPDNPLIQSHLGLTVQVGQGTAKLDAIGCDPTQKVTFTGQTAVAKILAPPDRPENVQLRVGIENFMDFLPELGPVLGPAVRLALRGLGLSNVGLDAFVVGQVGGSVTVVEREYPVDRLPDTIVLPQGGQESILHITDSGVDLTAGQGGLVEVLGEILDATLDNILEDLVEPLVNNTLDPTLTTVLNPMLDALGIRLGVAEIDVRDRPNCAAVRLVQ